jgi:uncharacterized protein (DUF3084 family)
LWLLPLSLFSHTLFARSVCTPRRHETSRRDLLKRCNNDVLVVLDHLRANLRIQLAFKEDYEQELKSTIDRRRSVHVQELEKYMNDKKQLETLLDEAHQRVLNAELDMEGVNDDKSRVTKECENMIKSFKKKLKQSDNDINSKNVVIETLKDELKEKEITIKNGDSKQLRIIQLENSLLQQKKTFARNFSKLRIAHRNEMQSIDVQMSMLRKDADQRASAVKENAGLKRDLSS